MVESEQRRTSNGTSLLIISWTFEHKLALLEKLTRYLSENVSETCWFISIVTPAESSSSFALPFFDFDDVVLGFLAGLDAPLLCTTWDVKLHRGQRTV